MSEENLSHLAKGGSGYIVGVPLRKSREAQAVLARPGRFQKVAENVLAELQAKNLARRARRTCSALGRSRGRTPDRGGTDVCALLARACAGLASICGARRARPAPDCFDQPPRSGTHIQGSGARLVRSLPRPDGAHCTSWRFRYSPLVRSVTVTGCRPRLRQNQPCIPSNAATSTPSSEACAVPFA
jgi:hypothetical protein